jgi:TFIIF-interacting CTD phosphatase-like protein
LDKIDPSRTLFAGRMYRQHCTQVDGSYVKDFTVVKNRRKQDMMLVDNLIYSFAADTDRGIHIKGFYDDKSDKELEYLAEVLDNMKPFMDVSEYLERNFGFQRFYDYL